MTSRLLSGGGSVVVGSMPTRAHDLLVVGLLLAAVVLAAAVLFENRRQQRRLETAVEDARRRAAFAERRFGTAFGRAGIGMAIIDTEGALVEVNDAFCELLGRSRAELVSTKAIDWVDVGSVTAAAELKGQMRAGTRVVVVELGFRTAGGQVVWTKVVVAALHDDAGRVDGFVAQYEDVTAARVAEHERAQAEARFRSAFHEAPFGVEVATASGVVDVNPALLTISGRRREELIPYGIAPFLVPEDAERLRRDLARSEAAGRGVFDCEARLIRPDGSLAWLKGTVVAVDGDSAVTRIVHVQDVTQARNAQAALAANEARFAALVERSTDMTTVLDQFGFISYMSPAGERAFGFEHGTLTSTPFTALVHPDDAGLFADLLSTLTAPGAVRTAEVRLRNHLGEWRSGELVATNRLDDPAVGGIVANIRDVTERAEAAARLAWQAFHDSLTTLPNRALLLDRVRHALDRAQRSGERTALLFVDLDRFKLVNDTMGHEAGDLLLVEVATRLESAVRWGDTVARLGGDEFVVLAEGIAADGEAKTIAARINAVLSEPVSLPQGEVTLSASIGIAFDRDHRADTLLREADTALYRAKERGKNRFEVFDESLRVEAMRRLTTEQVLRRALDDASLTVHYQPVVDLLTGAVVSVEALLRVPGPTGELQAPTDFIAVAEESGLVIPIGAGVLDHACSQLTKWRAELGAGAPPAVAINVSGRQLASPAFVVMVQRAMQSHGLGAGDLVLELTESTVIAADRVTLDAVGQLHELGVSLAIDDFGTGYSSLAYIRRFPIDQLKLDRTFVDGLGRQHSDTEIVRAVVSLGRTLGLVVVAEGIETPEQLQMLRDLGCDCGQGFLLCRPTAAEDLDLAGLLLPQWSDLPSRPR